MPNPKRNPPNRNAPQRKRPQPRVAIAHIDLARTYATALDDHIQTTNHPANKLLALLTRALDQAAAALNFKPKPPPENTHQQKLTG